MRDEGICSDPKWRVPVLAAAREGLPQEGKKAEAILQIDSMDVWLVCLKHLLRHSPQDSRFGPAAELRVRRKKGARDKLQTMKVSKLYNA